MNEAPPRPSGWTAATHPDSVLVACLIAPDLIEETRPYAVDVDAREGGTRGHTVAAPRDTATDDTTRVVEAVDRDGVHQVFLDTLVHGDLDRSL